MATIIVIHAARPEFRMPFLPSLFFPQWDAILLGSDAKGAILMSMKHYRRSGIEILCNQCDQDLLDATADEDTESEAGHAEGDEGDG